MDIDVIVERKSFDVELEVGNPVVEVKAPDHYNGPFDIFPSDEDQIIPVKEKMPVEDICVKGDYRHSGNNKKRRIRRPK